MKKLRDYLDQIKPVDLGVLESVQKRLDSQTKPQGSLGKLEEVVKHIAVVQHTAKPGFRNRVIFTLAADHGVVEEGVSAYPQSVTAQMVMNFVRGGAAVNVLARHAGCEVVVVDMGVSSDLGFSGFINKKIAYGTRNFILGPAMSRDQAERSILIGIELALEREFDILGTGDMGIGNTTASSAIASVLTGIDAALLTGRGTGIDDVTLKKKIEVIRKGIALNNPDPSDPLDVLSKVGGFEIGGIAGLIIGASIKNRVAVVDGFISTAGAIIASGLCKYLKDYFILSHLSAEKGHGELVEYLGKKPLLDLGMRLGEGTGAALAMEVIDAALSLYYEMATFDEAGVDKKLSTE
ncbi:MAG: nicotinate-nucleotide--dimethylbenzimidazole phosphoribosyltransferase [Spirochaetota bacterium]